MTRRSNRSSLSGEHVVSRCEKGGEYDDRVRTIGPLLAGSTFRFSVGLIAGSRACDPLYPLREHDEGVAINLSGLLSHLRESCGSSSPARSYEKTEGRIARWEAVLLCYNNNTDILLIRSQIAIIEIAIAQSLLRFYRGIFLFNFDIKND